MLGRETAEPAGPHRVAGDTRQGVPHALELQARQRLRIERLELRLEHGPQVFRLPGRLQDAPSILGGESAMPMTEQPHIVSGGCTQQPDLGRLRLKPPPESPRSPSRSPTRPLESPKSTRAPEMSTTL